MQIANSDKSLTQGLDVTSADPAPRWCGVHKPDDGIKREGFGGGDDAPEQRSWHNLLLLSIKSK